MSALTDMRRLDNLVASTLLTIGQKCKATKKFYKGAMVAVSGGYIIPAVGTTAGIRVCGIVDTGSPSYYDTTGESDGDTTLPVMRGIWKMKNSSSTDAIAQTEVGKDCYAVDDQTVAKTDGGVARPVAGQVVRVDTDGVFVAIGVKVFEGDAGKLTPQAAETVTSGAISVATRTTKLSVTGTAAYTLADGLFVGQRKTICCIVAASTPAGTVTPAHMANSMTSAAFNAVGDTLELEWNGSAWDLAGASSVPIT